MRGSGSAWRFDYNFDMVLECKIQLKRSADLYWRDIKARITPRYDGVLVEFLHIEQKQDVPNSLAPLKRSPGLMSRPVHIDEYEAGLFARPLVAKHNDLTHKAARPVTNQQASHVLIEDIQTICATQSRFQNELRILSLDEVFLIRTKDKYERDKILKYVASMELNRSVSVASGCVVDDALWPQDKRLLQTQKKPLLISSELTEVHADLFKPRDQTFDSLTNLRKSVRAPYKRVMEKIHAIHAIKNALEEEEEGVPIPEGSWLSPLS